MLHSSLQVRGPLAIYVLGKSCMACICVLSNLAVYEGIRQCIIASMYNGNSV
ncbi:hypothetical protein BDR05DRAFT_971224 [Suillus weaverae]|nr:hypothetical protein BDR05DRAFT_971224 [Suillus weaverae]